MKTLLLLAALCMVAASGGSVFPKKMSTKQLERLWPRIRPIAHYAISGRMPRNFGDAEGQLASPTEEDETDGGLLAEKRAAWAKEAAYLHVGEGVRLLFMHMTCFFFSLSARIASWASYGVSVHRWPPSSELRAN